MRVAPMIFLRLSPVSLLLLPFLSACAVDQKKEVAAYRHEIDPPTSQQAEDFGRIDPDAPLSLDKALQLANRNSERLDVEGENYLQSLINKKRAFASFLPTVSLVPTYTINDTTAQTQTGGTIVSSHNPVLDVPADAQMNLFNGFRDIAALRSAQYTIQQRRALLHDLQESVLLDVVNTYYQVLRSERSVVVLENSLAVQEQRVRDIKGRESAGLARPLDVAQTLSSASAARVTLLNARNDVKNGRATLVLLTNAPVQDSTLIDAFAPRGPLPSLDVLRPMAERRQDVVAANAAIKAARENVENAVGQYYPSIAVDFRYFLSRESSPTDNKWTALFDANVPIFTAGIIEADVRTAWSQFRQAVKTGQLTLRTARQQIETAYDNYIASGQRLSELRIETQAAQDAYTQADQSYNVGLATNLERLTAQDELLSSQLQLASEEFDNKTFYLQVIRSIGQLSNELQPEFQPATQPTPLAEPAPTTHALP